MISSYDLILNEEAKFFGEVILNQESIYDYIKTESPDSEFTILLSK